MTATEMLVSSRLMKTDDSPQEAVTRNKKQQDGLTEQNKKKKKKNGTKIHIQQPPNNRKTFFPHCFMFIYILDSFQIHPYFSFGNNYSSALKWATGGVGVRGPSKVRGWWCKWKKLGVKKHSKKAGQRIPRLLRTLYALPFLNEFIHWIIHLLINSWRFTQEQYHHLFSIHRHVINVSQERLQHTIQNLNLN